MIAIILYLLSSTDDKVMFDNWSSLNESTANVTGTPVTTSFGMDALELCMFVIVIAGVPGNVLVVAVYARKLTTSVRMYMFTLAVTDVAICLSYTTTAAMGVARKSSFVYKSMWSVFNFGVEFSVLVLTVTAVERYWCIARPHSFTFSPRRGKAALVITALLALATLIVIKVFRSFNLKKTALLHMMLHLGFCTLVILVMYTLLARELLLRFRRKEALLHSSNHSNNNASWQQSSNGQSKTDSSIEPPTPLSTGPRYSSVSTSEMKPAAHRITSGSKQSQEAKAALMLFVVTAVFLACWVPIWLRTLGVAVPRDVVRVYVIQSVVNPAIYGCMSRAFRDDVRHFLVTCRRELRAS